MFEMVRNLAITDLTKHRVGTERRLGRDADLAEERRREQRERR